MTITPELARVYASAPSTRRYIETLELSHPLFDQVYYLTNDPQAWQFQIDAGDAALTVFRPVPFLVQLPTQDGKGQQDLQIVIDNVGREIMDAIEAAAADPSVNITVTYRVFLDIANSLPQNDPPLVLALPSIVVGMASVTGTATRADVLNRPFPSEVYRVDSFPGLNR
jgi:hypothetical protein